MVLKVRFCDGNGGRLFTKRIDQGGFVWRCGHQSCHDELGSPFFRSASFRATPPILESSIHSRPS
nr:MULTISPECIES: hypothetical protein [unclassified Bradyrhizobium]